MAMEMKKKGSLGLYSPPSDYNVSPGERQPKRKYGSLEEEVYDGGASALATLPANGIQEKQRRTKNRAGGRLGIYS